RDARARGAANPGGAAVRDRRWALAADRLQHQRLRLRREPRAHEWNRRYLYARFQILGYAFGGAIFESERLSGGRARRGARNAPPGGAAHRRRKRPRAARRDRASPGDARFRRRFARDIRMARDIIAGYLRQYHGAISARGLGVARAREIPRAGAPAPPRRAR